MSGPSPWTEERLAMLRAEWASTASTAEIGRRMGISKGAVVGKAHRMGLPSREAPANIAKQKSWGVVSRPAARARRELPKVSETRAASPSRPSAASTSRAPSSRAVERRASSSPAENLPGAGADEAPRRVFLGTQCCYLMGDRTCDEPVQANARGLKSSYCPEHFAIIHAASPAKSANNPPPATWLKNRLAMRARG
jgi:GcrA cell cycle regulator